MADFYPIIPIDYLDHKSQQNRQANVHHFASKLIHCSTVRELYSKGEMVDLFLLLMTANEFGKIQRSHNTRRLNNFADAEIILDNVEGFKYLKFLVETAAMIEKKNSEVGDCYIFASLGPDFSKRPLEIMKKGLKQELNSQTNIIVTKSLK
jgi:hypothetical protein